MRGDHAQPLSSFIAFKISTLMTTREYLVSYGRTGDFGRFEAEEPIRCRRGEHVVIRSHRGQEIGGVMRAVAEGHMHLLAENVAGKILRRATPGDEELAGRMHQRSQRFYEDGRQLATRLSLCMEIVDA